MITICQGGTQSGEITHKYLNNNLKREDHQSLLYTGRKSDTPTSIHHSSGFLFGEWSGQVL